METESASWPEHYDNLEVQVLAPRHYYPSYSRKDDYSKKIVDSKNDDLSDYFFEEIKAIFPELPFTPDLIVIVPASKLGRFSTTMVSLCGKLSNALNIPFDKLIQRVREGKKLTSCPTQEERYDSVNGAFKVTRELNGENIVLLDDTKVSGVTLPECAKELKKTGASDVVAICLGINKS